MEEPGGKSKALPPNTGILNAVSFSRELSTCIISLPSTSIYCLKMEAQLLFINCNEMCNGDFLRFSEMF